MAEGTRLYSASEADLTVQFFGLHAFRTGAKATELHCHDVNLLQTFVKNGNVFNYPKFLNFLMEEIRSALNQLSLDDKIPTSFKKLNLEFKACNECEEMSKETSILNPVKHCTKCLPTVCHTKLGPCLIFQWMFGESFEQVMTVDLVPVFNVKGKTLDLFNKVMRTLLNDNPPGWKDYMVSIYKRDIILPEAFKSQEKGTNDDECQQIAIKLLNYGDENNYIIRPAQEMQVQDFQSNQILKGAYLRIKALNTILKAGVKSYLVKKILMLPEFKEQRELIKVREIEVKNFWSKPLSI